MLQCRQLLQVRGALALHRLHRPAIVHPGGTRALGSATGTHERAIPSRAPSKPGVRPRNATPTPSWPAPGTQASSSRAIDRRRHGSPRQRSPRPFRSRHDQVTWHTLSSLIVEPQPPRQQSRRRHVPGFRDVTVHRPGLSPHSYRRPRPLHGRQAAAQRPCHGPHRETSPYLAVPRRPIQRRAASAGHSVSGSCGLPTVPFWGAFIDKPSPLGSRGLQA